MGRHLYCRGSEVDVSNATRWAIAGTGRISGLFADCITRTGSGLAAHVLSRTPEDAEAFAGPRGATPWSDQRSMLSGAEIDALYIGTPHSEHAELAIQALSVGVPVLCEKPLSCSGAGTLAVVMAAHQNGTALVEGWMYRFHPQVERLLERLRSGAIGELRSIRSSFGFRADVAADHRLRNPKLGGGAILDIGGYPMSASMLVAGCADDRDFARPKSMEAVGIFDPVTDVDADAAATVTFDNGIEAEIRCSIIEDLGTELRCEGTEGVLTLAHPFTHGGRPDDPVATIEHHGPDGTTTETVPAELDCFSLEARAMSALIESGALQPDPPCVAHEESVTIAGALESWRGALEQARKDRT